MAIKSKSSKKLVSEVSKHSGEVRVGAVVRGLLKIMKGKNGRKFMPAPRVLSEVKRITKQARIAA
jgi:hypothetical protein